MTDFLISVHHRRAYRKALRALCGAILLAGAVPVTTKAAEQSSLVVTTKNDTTAQDGLTSLREAINYARTLRAPSTITFASNVRGTIQLTSALPTLNKNISIQGPGADLLTVSGGGQNGGFRVLTLNNVTLTISGLTISNGYSTKGGGGIEKQGGTLVLNHCTVSNNRTTQIGGAGVRSNTGTLKVFNCTFTGNSTIPGGFLGGGILSNIGTLIIVDSTFSGNSSNTGGGGAASNHGGTMTVINSTFTGNSALTGGNLFVDNKANLRIGNTLLKAGSSGGNLGVFQDGTITSRGNNLSDDAAGGDITTSPGGYLNASGDQRNTNPQLDAAGLANNGGHTQTIALQSTSPALNKGNNSLIWGDVTDEDGDKNVSEPAPFDQRGAGYARVQNTTVDIGAYEVRSGPAAPVDGTVSPAATTSAPNQARTFTATYSDVNGANDIQQAYLQVGPDTYHGLRVYYNAGQNKLYLLSNDLSVYKGGFAPGSNNTIANSQGTLNCQDTHITTSGNILTVQWSITPSAALADSPNSSSGYPLYLACADMGGLQDGLDAAGTWTITGNGAPHNVSLSPGGTVSNAVGDTRTFTAAYSDPNGANNLNTVYFQVKSGSTNVLRFAYNLHRNKLYLLSNNGQSYSGGYAPGTAHTLSNTWGNLDVAATKVQVVNSTTLNVSWVVTAGSGLAGNAYPILLSVEDQGGLSEGLTQFGTWNIASSSKTFSDDE